MRRALRVMRPGREKKRLRRVLVVDTGSRRPMRGPASQVMRHDLHGQPGGVGGEAARWQVVEPHAVFQSLRRT